MLSPGNPLVRLLPFVGQRARYVQQHSFMMLADVMPHQDPALRHELERIGSEVRNKSNTLFHNMHTVHYAAWLVLPGVRGIDGAPDGPARLLLETNYDGDLKAHLNDLIDHCGTALDQVYQYCEGYPPNGVAERAEVLAFLNQRYDLTKGNPTAYYVALPGRAIRDINNAISVYEAAKQFTDAYPDKLDPGRVHDELLNHLSALPDDDQPQRCPITQKGLRRLFVFNLICGIPVAVWKVILWLCLILMARFCFEGREQRQGRPEDPTDHPEDFTHLDLGHQNHLCTFATVKPGWFRMFVVHRALALGHLLASKIFILGQLDQMYTVHFLRWIVLDRQLLFVGNYDGNYSGYLSDFSDQAWGVNLIWGNTIGFPATRWLWRGGASDLQGFETQALTHYSPAPVFYSAYKNYSVQNLVRLLEFRDELAEAIAHLAPGVREEIDAETSGA